MGAKLRAPTLSPADTLLMTRSNKRSAASLGVIDERSTALGSPAGNWAAGGEAGVDGAATEGAVGVPSRLGKMIRRSTPSTPTAPATPSHRPALPASWLEAAATGTVAPAPASPATA